MRCVSYSDPAEFVTATAEFRAVDPYFTNVITTNATTRASGAAPLEDGAVWVSIVDEDGGVLGVAMRTPPYGLLLSPMPAEAIDVLAPVFADADLPSCDGPSTEAYAFAAASGRRWEPGLEQRLLVVREVIAPRSVAGRCRAATVDDAGVVVDWVRKFSAEAVPDQPPMSAEAVIRRMARPDAYWLWDVDGTPTSLCWRSAPAAGIVRIGAVYTPPEQRGHGYASANVATATGMALDAGAAACMLYTDQANPTSNKIYESIGYRHIGDATQIAFVS